MDDRRGEDRGAGTVAAVGLLAVAGSMLMGVGALGTVAVDRARADAAADLAALAGADVVLGRSPGVPCDAARVVASVNRAQVAGCSARAAEVTVAVTVPALTWWPGSSWQATATATAGRPR